MFDLAAQLQSLIQMVNDMRRRLARVEDVAAQAAQMVQMSPAGGPGGGGGGQQGFIGKAAVNIGARTGTSLAAGGQVDVYHDAGGTLGAVGTNVIARCSVSRTTAAGNGVDSGTWCWVELDPFGTYWCSPLDCT
jgi:hypothetical protein